MQKRFEDEIHEEKQTKLLDKFIDEEITYELGINLKIETNIKTIQIEKSNLKIPIAKQNKISHTDFNLLNTVYKNKQRCILITDDQILRQLAKTNKIKTYTTPQFIAYMLKNKRVSFKDAISILNKLRQFYIRPKDIDKIKKYINKWK